MNQHNHSDRSAERSGGLLDSASRFHVIETRRRAIALSRGKVSAIVVAQAHLASNELVQHMPAQPVEAPVAQPLAEVIPMATAEQPDIAAIQSMIEEQYNAAA